MQAEENRTLARIRDSARSFGSVLIIRSLADINDALSFERVASSRRARASLADANDRVFKLAESNARRFFLFAVSNVENVKKRSRSKNN